MASGGIFEDVDTDCGTVTEWMGQDGMPPLEVTY